jgi:hypothetical protein
MAVVVGGVAAAAAWSVSTGGRGPAAVVAGVAAAVLGAFGPSLVDVLRSSRDRRVAVGTTPAGLAATATITSGAELARYRVGVVPEAVACFQHRVEADDLDAALAAGGTAIVTQVLSGLGGVGKTQIAAELARRVWDEHRVDLLVWVTASSRDAIVSGYADAGVRVAGASPGDSERAAKRFLAWLAERDAVVRWLVVLDDVAHPAETAGWWPPQAPHGRVVVTTRRRDAALQTRGRLVPVGLFTRTEAGTYLAAKLGGVPGRLDGADELAEDLGLLPLALAQAAAYIVDRDIDCAEYRRRFADRTRHLTDLVPEDRALPDEHRATVAATWSLSVDAADELAPQGLARPMLRLLSVLDPNGVPAVLVISTPVLDYLTANRVGSNTSRGPVAGEDAWDAVGCLHRLNLATRATGAPSMVRVHALVSRATREQSTAEQLEQAARATADVLAQIWPDVERDSPLDRMLRTNAAVLRSHAEDILWMPHAHPVLFLAGVSLGETGQVRLAIEYFNDLVEQATRRLGPDHSDALTARRNLADWRGETGDAARAAAALAELLADMLRVLGPDHPDTLITRSNLAHWRGEAGNAAEAAAGFEELLSDQLRMLGPGHPQTLATRSNLSRWRGAAGDVVGAVAAFEELLADMLRVLGPDHPDTLATRSNLAHWRGEAGDVVGAVAAFEELLADHSRTSGPDHPDTLAARSNLATWRA